MYGTSKRTTMKRFSNDKTLTKGTPRQKDNPSSKQKEQTTHWGDDSETEEKLQTNYSSPAALIALFRLGTNHKKNDRQSCHHKAWLMHQENLAGCHMPESRDWSTKRAYTKRRPWLRLFVGWLFFIECIKANNLLNQLYITCDKYFLWTLSEQKMKMLGPMR